MVGSAEQSGGGVASVLRLARNADSAWIWCEVMVCLEGLFQDVVYDMAV